ncbi:MAG: pseudouridine synthase [Candidatus Aureabacteria bacterium]|nr:pseudouridine synthase [Candidatus Auribacterota bacterium]
MNQRLQKILAEAGYGSRRACETFIREERVRVNGAVAVLGSRADAHSDIITVDGEAVTVPDKIYLMLNKPCGYLCTSSDERGRRTVHDLLARIPLRLYTIGRLDRDAEGLLLLTNDGDFAQRIAHPRAKVGKTYELFIKGSLAEKSRKAIQRGIILDGRRTLPARITGVARHREGDQVTIEIREGRNRQLKRMFLAVGCPVKRLRRIAVGGLALGDLPVGRYRFLKSEELDTIFVV